MTDKIVDVVWGRIREQASRALLAREHLAEYRRIRIDAHEALSRALAIMLASDLMRVDTSIPDLADDFHEIIRANEIDELTARDIDKTVSVNAACPNEMAAFLAFRGIQAIQLHRIAHAVWKSGDITFAVLLQNWGAKIYNVDIHPGAKLGAALFVDHAMGIVIGETAVVEDDVSLWHGVTLGSTFSEVGDRHPKVRRGATIAANATILGNIEVGEGAVVAAGSVVLKSVPPFMLVAGVPAKLIKPVADSYAAIAASGSAT